LCLNSERFRLKMRRLHDAPRQRQSIISQPFPNKEAHFRLPNKKKVYTVPVLEYKGGGFIVTVPSTVVAQTIGGIDSPRFWSLNSPWKLGFISPPALSTKWTIYGESHMVIKVIGNVRTIQERRSLRLVKNKWIGTLIPEPLSTIQLNHLSYFWRKWYVHILTSIWIRDIDSSGITNGFIEFRGRLIFSLLFTALHCDIQTWFSQPNNIISCQSNRRGISCTEYAAILEMRAFREYLPRRQLWHAKQQRKPVSAAPWADFAKENRQL
jgi:hypothetical protein